MFFTKKQKIFCIGQNKTGTTSVELALKEHGFKMGDQYSGEALLDDYLNRDFKKIIKFCQSADAFQDIPFSLPYLYVHLDQFYSNSKFILTIRDNESQWYNSITKFHKKITLSPNPTPSYEDLQFFPYHKKGWLLKYMSIYGTPKNDLYNEMALKKFYNDYNNQVINYFRNKNNLLVLNLSEPDGYSKFIEFLNLEAKLDSFPWLNKTNTQI